jgi:hypothetical protein
MELRIEHRELVAAGARAASHVGDTRPRIEQQMGANERQLLAHRLVHAGKVRRVVGGIAAVLCVVARWLRHAGSPHYCASLFCALGKLILRFVCCLGSHQAPRICYLGSTFTMGRGPSTALEGDRMIRECEGCGAFFDLLGRDPYLPELRNYLCFSCESVASASARILQHADKKRRIESITVRP